MNEGKEKKYRQEPKRKIFILRRGGICRNMEDRRKSSRDGRGEETQLAACLRFLKEEKREAMS